MHLKLTRSQRDGGVVSRKVIFCLDARVQLTPEEQANVNRYKLGSEVIYNSEASKRHLDAQQAALATGTAGGIAKSFVSLAMAALNLNISINGLQRGQHIECKSLEELLGAEEALMQACQNLRAFLDAAATFDGREVLIDFSSTEPVVVSAVPPPMLVAPSAQVAPPPPGYAAPEASTAPIDDAAPVAAEALSQYQRPQSHSAGDNPFDDAMDKARRFWLSATHGQRIAMIVAGVFVLILLLRSCS